MTSGATDTSAGGPIAQNPGFTAIYAASAVVGLGASFARVFEDRVVGDIRIRYGENVWGLEQSEGGLAKLLVIIQVGLLLGAAFRAVQTAFLPACIVVVDALGLIELLAKPGLGHHKPNLGPGGAMLLGVVLMTLVVALAHCVVVSIERSRLAPPPLVPPSPPGQPKG